MRKSEKSRPVRKQGGREINQACLAITCGGLWHAIAISDGGGGLGDVGNGSVGNASHTLIEAYSMLNAAFVQKGEGLQMRIECQFFALVIILLAKRHVFRIIMQARYANTRYQTVDSGTDGERSVVCDSG